jgi:aromatic-L-amino-acid/L-tryptophan decarboxylase
MTLDPKNWDAFRATAHKMLDASIDKLENATEGRVWTPLPDAQKNSIQSDLPIKGTSPEDMQIHLQSLLQYGVGNTHPRFFGWVHGAGAASGLMAEIAAAAMNVNAGGRDHVAPIVERQVLAWSAEMMGMPKETSGLIVSGTSMATIIALKVARDQAQGGASEPLVGYTSEQTHSCVAQAFDILGLGREHLRKIACNEALELDISALKSAIARDKAAGLTPFLIVGTAGAVNMGAIDDLEGLADIAKANGLWFHIDGAFGATAVIGKHARARLGGLSRADSLAFDFHKWLQVNYEAGCVLIRDAAAHRASFSDRPEYLRGAERGLAGGAFWAVDYGPELSRGFRALKVWAHLKEYGVAALAKVIDRNIEQAQYLERLVKASDKLEMLAPVPLNICCFRYRFDSDCDALNEEIVVRLQESGIAVPSTTVLGGQLAIRVNLTNHRTRDADLDVLVEAVVGFGDGLA